MRMWWGVDAVDAVRANGIRLGVVDRGVAAHARRGRARSLIRHLGREAPDQASPQARDRGGEQAGRACRAGGSCGAGSEGWGLGAGTARRLREVRVVDAHIGYVGSKANGSAVVVGGSSFPGF